MAKLVALSAKNWSDSTWRKVGQCFVSNGGQSAANPAYSPVWNGNGNVDYGAILFHQGGNATTLVVTLQEYAGAIWNDRVAFTLNNPGYGFLQGVFNATHTETAGAGNYRLKMAQTGGSAWFLACTGGAWCAIMLDDATGVSPTDGDLPFIFATVTIDDAAPADIIAGDDNATLISGGIGGSGGAGVIIGLGGKLEYLYTATVSHTFKVKGDLKVQRGTIEIGTAAHPIGATLSFEFRLNYSASMTAFKYGFSVDNGSTLTLQGASRTISALLSGDEAVGQTELGLDVDLSAYWKSGEKVAIAGTSKAANQTEIRTLASDADVNHIDITAGLTNAHAGASPSRCDVISLFRNVRVVPADITKQTWTITETTPIIDIDYVYFSYAGTSSSSRFACMTILVTTGSCDIRYCVFESPSHTGIYMLGSAYNNITIKYNCIYNTTNYGIALSATSTGTTIDISYNLLIGMTGGSSFIWCRDMGGIISHNVCSSGYDGFDIAENAMPGTFSDNYCYALTQCGLYYSVGWSVFGYTFSNITCWRCYYGMRIDGCYYLTFNTYKSWGCNYNVMNQALCVCTTFIDSEFSGETGQTGTSEFYLIQDVIKMEFWRCKFGAISGNKIAMTQTFKFYLGPGNKREVYCDSCVFGDTNILETNYAYFGDTSWFKSNRHNNTTARNLTILGYISSGGILGKLSDHITGGQAADWARGGIGLCLLMDPGSTTRKLEWSFGIPCTNATPITFHMYIRKTAGSPTLSFNARGCGIVEIVEDPVTLTTSWAQYNSAAMTPSEDGFIEVTLKALDNASTGDIGIDDISTS